MMVELAPDQLATVLIVIRTRLANAVTGDISHLNDATAIKIEAITSKMKTQQRQNIAQAHNSSDAGNATSNANSMSQTSYFSQNNQVRLFPYLNTMTASIQPTQDAPQIQENVTQWPNENIGCVQKIPESDSKCYHFLVRSSRSMIDT